MLNVKVINLSRDKNKIQIGKNNNLSISILLNINGFFKTGSNVFINSCNLRIDKSVVIGNNVCIGPDCKIWDTDTHPIDPIKRKLQSQEFPSNWNISRSYEANSAPIIIEDNVCIGMNCIILKNVTIGQNSIIAAGSVVVKDVEPNSLYGGNPCKKIKNI